jgi:hypothetical protein
MEEFKISTRQQLKMFRFGMISLIVGVLIIIIYEILSEGFPMIDYAFFIGLLAAIGYIFIPLMIIHINYFTKNKKVKFQIDKTKYKLVSAQSTIEFYDNEIIDAILIKCIYYKQEIDKTRRWKASWSDYGYLRLQIKEFDNFIYLTSLMIDIKNPPLKKYRTIYKLFPMIGNELHPDKQRVLIEENQKRLINNFKIKFKNKSKTDLIQIIDNENDFLKEAVIAAKDLLNE